MAHDVEDQPIRVNHEEAAHAPRLVSQRVNDLESAPDRVGVDLVHIVGLHRHTRLNRRRFAVSYDADLRCRIGRRCERDDPSHVHHHVEAQQTDVERPALLESSRSDLMFGTTLLMFMATSFVKRPSCLIGEQLRRAVLSCSLHPRCPKHIRLANGKVHRAGHNQSLLHSKLAGRLRWNLSLDRDDSPDRKSAGRLNGAEIEQSKEPTSFSLIVWHHSLAHE